MYRYSMKAPDEMRELHRKFYGHLQDFLLKGILPELLCILDCLFCNRKSDLYGIDISADMLKQVTERNKAATKQGKLHLQIGDCCDLPYDDDLADTKKGFKKFESNNW